MTEAQKKHQLVFLFLLPTLVQCRVVRLGVLKDTKEHWGCGALHIFSAECMEWEASLVLNVVSVAVSLVLCVHTEN